MQELPVYDAAVSSVLKNLEVLNSETLDLRTAAERVLRGEVCADRDQPPFDRSAMDGFALRAGAWGEGKSFRVVGSVPAGGVLPGDLAVDPERDVVRIATGAAVPGVFDAVVQIEKSVEREGGEPAVVFDVEAVRPGMNIHRRGADATAGQVVIPRGTRLQPHHLGIAAAVGATQLSVSRRPRVIVLSSGDEVRPPETATPDLEPQQIRNSNGPMLIAMLNLMGCEVVRHEHVVDEADAVKTACERAADEADLVVTTGGVSVGQRDLFPDTWPTLGFETVLHGVKMQPGKPVFIAKRQSSSGPSAGGLVVGLPGNPVSVWATAHLFVWPIVRKLSGLEPTLPWRRVWLAVPAKGNARREAYRAARFVGETREQVEVIAWQGSGDLTHTASADGLLRMPIHAGEIPAGSGLSFLPILGGWPGGGA